MHASVLDRAGIAGLTEGQRVAVDVIDGRKGSRGGRFTPDLKAVDCLSERPPSARSLNASLSPVRGSNASACLRALASVSP